MLSNHILMECLKQRMVWWTIALIAASLDLLRSPSYGAGAVLGLFVLAGIFGMLDRFVFSQITPERITIIPDLRHDLTLDMD